MRWTWWGSMASAIAYALLHLLLIAALVTFGQRAGGYPLQPLAIAAYGLTIAAGLGLALRASLRGHTAAERVEPLLALAVLLAAALAGAFFATPILGGFGLRTEYAPYLDNDGAFAMVNVGLAVAVAVAALAARRRRLLVGALAAQGLALLLNPGLIAATVRYGLPPNAYGLLAVPVVYAGGMLALGWRPRRAHLAWLAGLGVGGMLLGAGLLLVAYPELWRVLSGGGGTVGALVPWHILATGAFCPFVLGLPVYAWRLRTWAANQATPRPEQDLAAAGVGLALLVCLVAVSWPYLGPAHGLGDNWLPEAGKQLGWIGKTVPEGAYGAAGALLAVLKGALPWLLGAAALLWLVAALSEAARLGPRGTLQAIGFAGGLALVGAAVLWQSPLLPFPLLYAQPPLIHGLAAALPQAMGQEWLATWLFLGYGLLGLALVGASAALRSAAGKQRGGLTLSATLLALLAAALLTAGLWAGTVQSLATQHIPGLLAEHRQAAQLRLALSLPVNAALALMAWAVACAGLRAVVAGPAALSKSDLGRGLALAGSLAVIGTVAFWQLTAMPVAEASPRDGAVDVPTNMPIVVRLQPEPRNWGPGIVATYADTGEHIRGTAGGSAAGEASFAPDGGWRPGATIHVQVMSPLGHRTYTFSFTAAGGPSPDVTPLPGPGPMPTAPGL